MKRKRHTTSTITVECETEVSLDEFDNQAIVSYIVAEIGQDNVDDDDIDALSKAIGRPADTIRDQMFEEMFEWVKRNKTIAEMNVLLGTSF